MGFQPHSVVSSAQMLSSLTPAEGASPLARSPRKGRTPFEIPTVVGVQSRTTLEEVIRSPLIRNDEK